MVDLNGTLLVQFINFFLLVAILAKFAYKPLLKVMQDRQERIAQDLEGAQEARLQAQELEKSYKEQLANARVEAQKIIEKAMKQADEEGKAQLEEVRAQIAKEKAQAKEEIIMERERAMRQMRKEVVSLSVALAGKVVEKNMDSDANARLVNDAIEKLDSKTIGM